MKVALIGNPNVGKSSVFNVLSGLRQKTGNYPGITVDIKHGKFKHQDTVIELFDLPGTYSLYPTSKDEELVQEVLLNPHHKSHPDKVVLIADPFFLRRSLLLYYQIKDLGIPIVLVFNLWDELQKNHISTNEIQELSEDELIFISAKKNMGIEKLKDAIVDTEVEENLPFFEVPIEYQETVQELQQKYPQYSSYHLWLFLATEKPHLIPQDIVEEIQSIKQEKGWISKRLQTQEALRRYEKINIILEKYPELSKKRGSNHFTQKLDKILTHKVFGILIFLGILYLIFQSLFYFASIPMDLIDGFFGNLSTYILEHFPEGLFTQLLAEGIVPGIGGVVIFIPQIAILFIYLFIMEECGYMSRVVFMMDRLLQPLGMSGKSIVPLISGVACAIPAIMSARNIENNKERLITLLVTPFMTCSARLPVYIIIISLIIPKGEWGIFNYQGTVLMGMYLVGFLMALFGGFILKYFIKTQYTRFLVMEMPNYRWPIPKNILYGTIEKVKDFVWEAGKIIFALSVIIWALGTFGPNTKVNWDEWNIENSTPLEESYLGKIGKSIEPAIEPLGYDWKIGIGVINSFIAREVFVSTMATIYSIDYEDEKGEKNLISKMKSEVRQDNGQPIYSLATGLSLLFFYAFAMQCVSTLAVVKKETRSWKWPILQFLIMTSIAYIFAYIAYQTFK